MNVVQPATVRVLVVDDHPPFREAVVAMLGLDPRYLVVGEAADGEAAVELAARLTPTLVVMDVRLPGISGIEATARIHARQPDVAVVLVSTQSAAELPAGYESCGALAFSPKESLDLELFERVLSS